MGLYFGAASQLRSRPGGVCCRWMPTCPQSSGEWQAEGVSSSGFQSCWLCGDPMLSLLLLQMLLLRFFLLILEPVRCRRCLSVAMVITQCLLCARHTAKGLQT